MLWRHPICCERAAQNWHGLQHPSSAPFFGHFFNDSTVTSASNQHILGHQRLTAFFLWLIIHGVILDQYLLHLTSTLNMVPTGSWICLRAPATLDYTPLAIIESLGTCIFRGLQPQRFWWLQDFRTSETFFFSVFRLSFSILPAVVRTEVSWNYGCAVGWFGQVFAMILHLQTLHLFQAHTVWQQLDGAIPYAVLSTGLTRRSSWAYGCGIAWIDKIWRWSYICRRGIYFRPIQFDGHWMELYLQQFYLHVQHGEVSHRWQYSSRLWCCATAQNDCSTFDDSIAFLCLYLFQEQKELEKSLACLNA